MWKAEPTLIIRIISLLNIEKEPHEKKLQNNKHGLAYGLVYAQP